MYTFVGQVVAILTPKGSKEQRIVLAPERTIYYEPEILDLLKTVNNLKVAEISCLYEKSCGALIFYRNKQGARVLLVKNHNGRYWSFPKGHMELNETEQETAVREIKEETNLDVQIIDGFREVSDYCPFGNIKKRVVFFLAQAFTDDVTDQPEEIADHIWVDIQQARKYCTYENDLRVIDKAELLINQSKIKS
ncbi:MAG: NUDIX domain-containing protein [Ruminococcus sp.]|nr:NUDIX domain-containing protein [Ruminococcus sp.]